MTDRYAVIGNPIAHSKSPKIHTQFGAQTGEDIAYGTLLGPLDAFEKTVTDFFNEGGKGLNVTVPFKEQAWAMCEVRSKRAAKAGAVNTLLLGKDGRLYGDNTDGVGIVRDIENNHGVSLKDKRILMLGAGGAVRGVIAPILLANPKSLVIANRTATKAQTLADLFTEDGPITAITLSELAGNEFDVIINGTSASLSGELPDLPNGILAKDGVVYDMMYGQETPFITWAKSQGAAKTLDGSGMLVEQAAEAFFIWRGVRPETKEILALLRANS